MVEMLPGKLLRGVRILKNLRLQFIHAKVKANANHVNFFQPANHLTI